MPIPFWAGMALAGTAPVVASALLGGNRPATQSVSHVLPGREKLAGINLDVARKYSGLPSTKEELEEFKAAVDPGSTPIFQGDLFAPTSRHYQSVMDQLGPRAFTNLQSPGELSAYDYGGTQSQISGLLGGGVRGGGGGFGASAAARRTIAGDYLEGSGLREQIARQTEPIHRQFRQSSLPALYGALGTGIGRTGTQTAAALSTGVRGELADALAKATGNIVYDNYARERGLQEQAIGRTDELRASRGELESQLATARGLKGADMRMQLAEQLENLAGRAADDRYRTGVFNIDTRGAVDRYNLERQDSIMDKNLEQATLLAELDEQLAGRDVKADTARVGLSLAGDA